MTSRSWNLREDCGRWYAQGVALPQSTPSPSSDPGPDIAFHPVTRSADEAAVPPRLGEVTWTPPATWELWLDGRASGYLHRDWGGGSGVLLVTEPVPETLLPRILREAVAALGS